MLPNPVKSAPGNRASGVQTTIYLGGLFLDLQTKRAIRIASSIPGMHTADIYEARETATVSADV